jgi:hypothetical protein
MASGAGAVATGGEAQAAAASAIPAMAAKEFLVVIMDAQSSFD